VRPEKQSKSRVSKKNSAENIGISGAEPEPGEAVNTAAALKKRGV